MENRTLVEVVSKVENESVFIGQFYMYGRTDAQTGGINMKISLDGMGGDNAPEEIVKGALESSTLCMIYRFIFYGDEKAIAPYLTEHERLTVIHTHEVIEGDDEPVRAIRQKERLPQWLKWLNP